MPPVATPSPPPKNEQKHNSGSWDDFFTPATVPSHPSATSTNAFRPLDKRARRHESCHQLPHPGQPHSATTAGTVLAKFRAHLPGSGGATASAALLSARTTAVGARGDPSTTTSQGEATVNAAPSSAQTSVAAAARPSLLGARSATSLGFSTCRRRTVPHLLDDGSGSSSSSQNGWQTERVSAGVANNNVKTKHTTATDVGGGGDVDDETVTLRERDDRHHHHHSNHHHSSEEDECSDRSVTSSGGRNSQFRSTLTKAKHRLSFDKWRSSPAANNNTVSSSSTLAGSGGGSAMTSPQPEVTSPGEQPGTGGGRLSRWFSMRRGSSHHYDVGGKESATPAVQRSGSLDLDDRVNGGVASAGQTPSSSRTSCGSGKMPQLMETEEDRHSSRDHLPDTSSDTIDAATEAAARFDAVHLFARNGQPSGGTLSLPPAPTGLSAQQLKRRHIVAAIIHSENSYVATLQRLVNDYKKPLEHSQPPILSAPKIATLFHRLADILATHTHFRQSLVAPCRHWDSDERIGGVFTACFGRAAVLDVYSGFINNFSAAMELAKQEAKRKSALADFFKVKQISAHDRLSFFGLMVKPVQRFPQFILFLQDLLKHTPHGHADRMALQLALTQLEQLAEQLNERKREAEQCQAFREMLAHIGGSAFNARALSAATTAGGVRYLVREDNVTQMEFNAAGLLVKSKQRRLLLLNDKVLCVSVAPKQSADFGATEKLSFKWMVPVVDVEIVDASTSATLSRMLTAGANRSGSLKSNGSGDGATTTTTAAGSATAGDVSDNLCTAMSTLMHDYEVMSRINDLVGTLKGAYAELNAEHTRTALAAIQTAIQKKDEEMAWVDSCCMQLVCRQKGGKEETLTFQTAEPAVKKEWVTELRLAQLALDANNSPAAWVHPQQRVVAAAQEPDGEGREALAAPPPEAGPDGATAATMTTKMPLFVRAKSVVANKSHQQTEVRCGCYYSTTNPRRNNAASRRRLPNQSYVWLCTTIATPASSPASSSSTTTTASTHIHIQLQHAHRAADLKSVNSFTLTDHSVSAAAFVRGIVTPATVDLLPAAGSAAANHTDTLLDGDTVWLGTDGRQILIYCATNPEQELLITTVAVPAPVTHILQHMDAVFVGLASGSVLVFRRSAHDALWSLHAPQTVHLSAAGSSDPIAHMLPINAAVYAACGRRIWVLNGQTGDPQRAPFDVAASNTPPNVTVHRMAHSGVGLWVSLRHSPVIALYHTETLRHLQDINVAASVLRVTASAAVAARKAADTTASTVHVTALMACRGLLWCGTNVGIALTIPLPRLEGVPIVSDSGGVSVAYHAHFGAVTFLLPLVVPAKVWQASTKTATAAASAEQGARTLAESPKGVRQEEPYDEDISSPQSATTTTTTTAATTTAVGPPVRRRLEKQSSLDIGAKLRATLTNSPVVLRRRRFKDGTDSPGGTPSSKTLPRGGSSSFSPSTYSSASSASAHSSDTAASLSTTGSSSVGHGSAHLSAAPDVYGLYGGLIYVKEDYYDPAASKTGGPSAGCCTGADCLRRSDPELAAIPAKMSTLDRRLRMKVTRPRSLDLSNWSVDSRSSSLYTASSGSEESMAVRMFAATVAAAAAAGRSVSRNSSNASQRAAAVSDLRDICELGDGTTSGGAPTGTIISARRTQSATSADLLSTAATSGSNVAEAVRPLAQSTLLHAAPTPSAVSNPTIKTKKSKKSAQQTAAAAATDAAGRRTVITLMGGRGYINWRPVWQCADGVAAAVRTHKTSTASAAAVLMGATDSGGSSTSSSAAAAAAAAMAAALGGGTAATGAIGGAQLPNATDAHVIVWEKKL